MGFTRPKIQAAPDPAVEQARAEQQAAIAANNQAASTRRQRRQTALSTGASSTAGTAVTGTALAQGKQTLGAGG